MSCLSGIIFIGYAQNRKIGKQNNSESLGAIKRPEPNIKNWLRSPMSEVGEP